MKPTRQICTQIPTHFLSNKILFVLVKTAKSEWKKLRDNHRDSLKRQKCGKTGQAAPAINNWKYAQIMDFLLPFMKNRKVSTNLTNSQCTQEIIDQNSTQDSELCTQQSTQEVEESIMLIPLANNEGPECTQETQTTRKRKNDVDIIDIIKDIEENHNRRQEERDNIRKKQQEKHPMDLFFESMAQTAKNMPIYFQNKIKKKVLQIVCDTEEEMESYNTGYGYSTASTSSVSAQSPPTTSYEQLP